MVASPRFWIASVLAFALVLVLGGTSNGQAPAPHSARADAVRADVKAILSNPDFQFETGRNRVLEGIGNRIKEAVNRFLEWLGKLFQFGGRIGSGGNILFWIVLAALLVGMAALIAYLVVRAEKKRSGANLPPLSLGRFAEEEVMSLDPELWLARARQLISAGDFRGAYRAAFLSLLLRLDQSGTARFDPSRTNGDYLRLLRSHQDTASIFRPAARDFDSRWYGGRSIGEPDCTRLVEASLRLVRDPR